MMRVALLLAILLAGCSAAPPPAAPEPTGRIDGAVVNEVLQPFSHLNVTLVGMDRVDETSDLGGFTFRELPYGTYTVMAKAPGTLGDVRVVEVSASHPIGRTILQLLPIPVKEPFSTSIRNRAEQDLAQPGTACDACAWGTYLYKHPDEAVVKATWDSLPVGNAQVTMRVLDGTGNELGATTGNSPLEIDVPPAKMPANIDHLRVEYSFPSDFTPQPFDVESTLDLFYNGPKPVSS